VPAAPARVQGFDQALLWVTVALLAWGLVMVYSASIALPDNPRSRRYAHTHFLVRHALFLGGVRLRAGCCLPGPGEDLGAARPGCSSPRCCCWSWCWCRTSARA
jgi:hypothetical protein